MLLLVHCFSVVDVFFHSEKINFLQVHHFEWIANFNDFYLSFDDSLLKK